MSGRSSDAFEIAVRSRNVLSTEKREILRNLDVEEEAKRSLLSGTSASQHDRHSELMGLTAAQRWQRKNAKRVTRKMIVDMYQDEKLQGQFHSCGIRMRDLVNIYDEIKRARIGDTVSKKPLDFDDLFEALLFVRNKVQPLQMVYVGSGLKMLRRRLDLIEINSDHGQAALMKSCDDIGKLLGPFQVGNTSTSSTVNTGAAAPGLEGPSSLGVGPRSANASVITMQKARPKRKAMSLRTFGGKEESPGKTKATGAGTTGGSGTGMVSSVAGMTPAEMARVKKLKQAEQEAKIFDRFDAFFGLFVVGNGICIGMQVNERGSGPVWFAIDASFLFVFSLELFVRAVLTNQLSNYQDDTVIYGFLPRMERTDIFKWLPDTLRNSKSYISGSRWVQFDIIIVAVGAFDLLLQVASPDGNDQATINTGWVSVFRIFRLMRLCRLVHLFRSLRELWLLVDGMLMSGRTLFWVLQIRRINWPTD